MRNLIFSLCALALAGCVASGVKVDEKQLSGFQKGKTTYSDVIAQLGTPTSSTLRSDGVRTVAYSYVQAQARPESFIPIVGAFAGGADSRASFVVLVFDADGVLTSFTSSTAQYGMGTGLESGNPANGRTDQPKTQN